MMQRKSFCFMIFATLIFILAFPACAGDGSLPSQGQVDGESYWEGPTSSTGLQATRAPARAPTESPDWGNSVTWLASDPYADTGIQMETGGDTDTQAVSLGDGQQVQRTGNGEAMPSGDNNNTEDFYIQFALDDSFMSHGSPTSHVLIEVEYLDNGLDMFSIHYDALGEGGPFGDGRYTETPFVFKTDSGEFRTAEFVLRDAFFANRDNDGDFRIADSGDGPESIRRVMVTLILPSSDPATGLVIDFYDDGNYLTPGQCTTLHWTVQNATEVTLNGGQIDLQGYRYLCPQSTTTYVLHAQNDVEDKQEAITIQVSSLPRPVYDFAASCGPFPPAMGIPGISYEVSFEGQPGQLSGPVTSHWYASIDSSHEFIHIHEAFCNQLPHESTCQSGFQTGDRCCQIVLVDNDDTNPTNDIYTTCW